MSYFRKAFLMGLFFTLIVWSEPLVGHYPESGLFSRIHPLASVQQKPNTLAKKDAIRWIQTGATHWKSVHLNDSSWEFISRDTIIYDASGNEILRMTSNAHSGWDRNSLDSLDSTIYRNGKEIEHDHYVLSGSKISYGSKRFTYNYLNGDKTLVETDYSWDVSVPEWVPVSKDSIIFSTPLTNSFIWYISDMHVFIKDYRYMYENSTWKNAGFISKVDNECNSTTLVTNGKQINRINNSLVDFKNTVIYNSSAWSDDDVAGDIFQEINPVDGKYHVSFKSVYSSNGFTNYNYVLDSISNDTICNDKQIYFTDSHKNYTLIRLCSYNTDTHSWDSSTIHYSQIYDSNGNNISSTFEPDGGIWKRDINSFKQINVPVTHFVKANSGQNVSILQTAGFIYFSAPNIIELKLYNIEGRLVSGIKQNANSSITMSLIDPNKNICSGSYIAKLIRKDAINSFPLVIKRGY